MHRMLFSLLLALAACAPPAAETPPDETRIVTYEVPEAEAERVESTLRQLVAEEGRVTALAPGRIAVAARPGIQVGVAQAIAEIADRSAAGVPDLEFRYWILATVDDPDTPAPALPAVLEPVASELARHHGPLRLRVRESRQMIARSGDEAQIDSTSLMIVQRAALTADGDRIISEIHLQLRQNTPRAFNNFTGAPIYTWSRLDEVQTRLRHAPDQLVVLAERTFEGDTKLFYVVQAAVRPR